MKEVLNIAHNFTKHHHQWNPTERFVQYSFKLVSRNFHWKTLIALGLGVSQSWIFLFLSRKFYVTVDMTNLCPFIQGSLESSFSELFSANVSVWNQYKYIAFNIFWCRLFIISYKMLLITEISNEKTNELTIYGALCRNVITFYRQELPFLFQVQEKLGSCRSSK